MTSCTPKTSQRIVDHILFNVIINLHNTKFLIGSPCLIKLT
jgi:hypothetical protein